MRNEPDWCTTWMGRLQQDGDGRFRFIQRSFRLILWHQRGWKSISGLFVQHKSSTFQIWPIPIFTREINDACLHWPRSSILQLLPLCINRQHFLVAFTPLTHVRPLLPCPSIYLSKSLHSNLFILHSLNGITEIGDDVAFGETHLCYTPWNHVISPYRQSSLWRSKGWRRNGSSLKRST